MPNRTMYLFYVGAKRAEIERRKNYDRSSDHCIHGTYIGTWWGPDYLCGHCESGEGDSITEMAYLTAQQNYEQYREYQKAVDAACAIVESEFGTVLYAAIDLLRAAEKRADEWLAACTR